MAEPNQALNEATRVAAAATRTHYDSTSIALHWITVALVLLNFASAELWGLFARPTRHLMIVSHMSLGILLSIVVVVRIVWRFMPDTRSSRPRAAGTTGSPRASNIFSICSCSPSRCSAISSAGRKARR